MKKISIWRIVIIGILCVIAACSLFLGIIYRKAQKQWEPEEKTVETSYGDKLLLTASYTGSMHDSYLQCTVESLDSHQKDYFYIEVPLGGRIDHPFDTFKEVFKTETINIYCLQDVLIFVFEDDVCCYYDRYGEVKDREGYLEQFDEPQRAELEYALEKIGDGALASLVFK